MNKHCRINWTEELANEIKYRYTVLEESLVTISKNLGIGCVAISNFLKRNSIEVINRQNHLEWTLEEVVDLYDKGISLTKIAKLKNTTRNCLAKHLKRAGIDVINRQNVVRFNSKVFDSIDTEEKAYWLGFIYADGCIYSRNKGKGWTLEISLKGSDKLHLEKFNKFIGYQGNNVKERIISLNQKKIKVCRWQSANKHLCQTLNSYGCVPRKSLILEFPNINIFSDKSLIRHFIRGYFDGDGCISRNIHIHTVSPMINILGTESFLNDLLKYTDMNLQTKLTNANPTQNITKEMNFSKESAVRFINYLYENSSIYLERKHNLYQFFKKGSRSVQEWTEFNKSKSVKVCDDNTEVNTEIKESVSP